jgi:tetratricopeptide (TPR) repeat protein
MQSARIAAMSRQIPAKPVDERAPKAIPELLKLAFAAHQAGRLDEAEGLYRHILAIDGHHADSLHLLGVIALQKKDYESAVSLIRQAIVIKSGIAAYYSNLGAALRALGRAQEAVDCYQHALRLKPDYLEAHYNLANALCDLGKLEEAIPSYQRALALGPESAEADAVASNPDSSEVYCKLGNALLAKNELAKAAPFFERSLTLRRDNAEAHNCLGFVLEATGRLEEAREHYGRARDLAPEKAEYHSNLGNVLQAQGRLDEAIQCHQRALELEPGFAKGYNNLAVVFAIQGRINEAMALYEHALTLDPDYVQAQLNRSMLQLLQGDFASGWRNYESRWQALKQRSLTQPRWQGEPLAGKCILLHAEQGLGDTLQFLRYLPQVQAAGGSVVLEVPARLLRLAAQLPGVAELVTSGDPLPPFDCHCPLMSLPLVFGTTLESIPADVPYLSVPAEAMQSAAALRWPAKGLRVGLVWSGNPDYGKNLFRSMALRQLEPLLDLEGIHFFSLQMGAAAAQLAQTPAEITDLAPVTSDMADTAAQIAHLDLVITVDTSVAHMAGALAKPVWLLLPLAPNWRWLQERADSPWYPQMRLFRQPRLGDWPSVVEAVRKALVERSAQV